MAHLNADTSLAAKGGYAVQDRNGGRGSLRGRKIRTEEESQQKSGSSNAIVVEQWVCFVLGFACMAFGGWGICMRFGQHALSRHIAWLGSLYVPALRLTAVACLGMGLLLIRRGWSHL